MNRKKITFFFVFLGLIICIPYGVEAVTISVFRQSNTAIVGDTIVLDVLMDTEGKTVNVVDGALSFTGSNVASVSETSIANSAFNLWPNKPSIERSKSTISFVGGIPNGIKGSSILLYKIIVDPMIPGQFSIQGNTITVYESDGKGTGSVAKVTPFTLSVLSNDGHIVVNEWNDVTKADTTAPAKFSLEIGRDESVYDNKYFMSFDATDADSGIEYYEVREGSLLPVRSGSPYVLQNQDPNQQIKVTAYDRAGNQRVSTVNSPTQIRNILLIIILIGVLIVAGTYLYRKRKTPKLHE